MLEQIKTMIEQGLLSEGNKAQGVYEKSVRRSESGMIFAFDAGDRDVLVGEESLGLEGTGFEAGGKRWVLAEQTHENAQVLRRLFPFTAPAPILSKERTVGVGDRLGIASPGHIQVFEKYDAVPVLAQQSIRELNLTKRTFADVLDSASFAVFREGFEKGFGADGDHVKTEEEVGYALSSGYTMITLDCSEHIRDDSNVSPEQLKKECESRVKELSPLYLDREFEAESNRIVFSEEELTRICYIYGEAIDFAVGIWDKLIADKQDRVDFEISIDETSTPTTPAQHFFVANELIRRGVRPVTVAPRFCGEFQKGIDYIGDLAQFEKEFAVHAAIARHFGYKISVHSGSDKFSVFETVGRLTRGRFHLKTAGTNWLEAMRVTALHDPQLYREIHQYALDTAFNEARQFYHVTTDLTKIPSLDTLTDDQLPALFENPDARQLIHITYGQILNEKDAEGKPRFKDRLYAGWRTYRDEYERCLEKHIGRHLEELYKGIE